MASRRTRSARRASARRPVKDALHLLAQDHRRVHRLFRQYARLPPGDPRAQEIVGQVCRELEIHARLEEQIFYPAARRSIRDAGLVDEAGIEHRSLQDLIDQLGRLDPADPQHASTFRVLAAYVRRHVKREESLLFPQVRQARIDTASLGKQLHARREQLVARMDQVTTAQAMAGALGGLVPGRGYREGARGP